MMTCGPCKETADCVEILEDNEEYGALTELYRRLFEPRDEPAGRCPPSVCDDSRDPSSRHECPPPSVLPPESARKPVARCSDGAIDDSLIKRVDRQLTALLREHRDGGGGTADEGDVKHLTDNLPVYKSCKNRKPGAVNATLFGLDLEHWMTATTAGDGRDDDVKRAAYDLAMAEAHCKHAGAVEAAEKAVLIEPAGHLAEVAARFGAQSYAGAGANADGTGQDAGDGLPVVVVAYVGSTDPTPSDD